MPLSNTNIPDLEHYHFRELHPRIFIGTASDRYAGWIGQIYSEERYRDRITSRTKQIKGKSFREDVLPVESVEEYFTHFRVLEIDFTFYRFLLERAGEASQNFHVLHRYREHLKEGDGLFLKVPQAIFAQKLLVQGKYVPNEQYLDRDAFARRFYEPAREILGPYLRGFIFEQEYQRREERIPPAELARSLDSFFGGIPRDSRYHVELRTESYLAPVVLDVLEKHGVGQVLSHWTWLPPLRKQFEKGGSRFTNAGGQSVLRLMTPRGMRYEDAYARAHPFDRMVEGMLQPSMVEETVQLMQAGMAQDVDVNVMVNNRAGGNAPSIARRIAESFLGAVNRGEKRPQSPL